MTDELKSAVELAMERMERETGDAPRRLSDEQKRRIAAVRAKVEARIAEEEIAAQSHLRAAAQKGDSAAFEEAKRRLASEKRRLEESRDREIEKIRREG